MAPGYVNSHMPIALRFVRVFAVYVFICSLACSAAPTRRHVDMPTVADVSDTGSLTLVFSRTTSGVIVSVNGRLVVEGEKLKRLHIGRVESGYADLAIAADGVERQMRVWVESGRDSSVPIGAAPMPPAQSPWASAGLSILALVISRSVSNLFF